MNLSAIFGLTALVLMAPTTVAAQSRAELEQRRQQLTSDIQQAVERLEPVVEPWLHTRDLHVSLSPRPLLALIEELNTLTNDERTTKIAVTDHSGQLAGTDRECWVGPFRGRQGWFVEFKDRNLRARSDVRVSDFTASWVPGSGPRVGFHVDLDATVGTLHGHWDPECLTGGIGFDAGPATCTGSSDVTAALVLAGLEADQWRYSLRAGISGLDANCRVSAGSLGSIPFSVREAVPKTDLTFDGIFRIPLDLEGQISIPSPNPSEIPYRLVLRQANAEPTSGGLLLESDIEIEWR